MTLTNNKQKQTKMVYIKFLNKDKNFEVDTKEFELISDAVKWGFANIGGFNLDMIYYK